MQLRFTLYSAGVLASGVNSLSELLSAVRSGQPLSCETLALPAPTSLPANERRRASQVARLALACAEQALLTSPYPPQQLRCVFASDEGTGDVCVQMLEALTTTGQVSPLLFHNSVHNAPSGYFSIAYQNRQSAVSVSMGEESFASGLLCAVTEAKTSGQPVLFVAYDSPVPEPIRSLLAIEHATAAAWVIASDSTSGEVRPAQPPLASFELTLHPADVGRDLTPPKWMPPAWTANSSAGAFAVLALLADGCGKREFAIGAQRLRVTLMEGAHAC